MKNLIHEATQGATMSRLAPNAELAALLELRRSTDLAFIGCAFHRCLGGSISVSIGRRALGAWWHENGAYHFAATAYRKRPEISVNSIEAVVAATREIAAKHAMYLSYEEHGIAIHNSDRVKPHGFTTWNH